MKTNLLKPLVNISAVLALQLAFVLSLSGTASAQPKFNLQVRDMVEHYLSAECAKGEAIRKEMNDVRVDDAFGIIDLRLKCFADAGDKAAALPLLETLETKFSDNFLAIASRYYAISKLLPEQAAEAREELLAAHAKEPNNGVADQFIVTRDRVRRDDGLMIEIREDLAFYNNTQSGVLYQLNVLENLQVVFRVVIGSSPKIETQLKEFMTSRNAEAADRYFHADFFRGPNEVRPIVIYDRLPTFEEAKALVNEVANRFVDGTLQTLPDHIKGMGSLNTF